MGGQRRCPGEQGDDYTEGRTRMAEHLNRKEDGAYGPDHRVNSIPRGIQPRNFVGEKLQPEKNTRNGDDHRVAHNLQ